MPTASPTEPVERLVGLLGYVKEVVAMESKNREPRLALEETKVTRKTTVGESSLVLSEGTFRKIGALCEFGRDGTWLRVRRPCADEAEPRVGELARGIYAELFAARQEALRGNSEIKVGVGLVKWGAISHPLVELSATLELDPVDGAMVLGRAEGCRPTIWTFPGVVEARPAVAEVEACARDYGLLNRPIAPTDREAWAPLLRRAAHTLGPDGEYFDGPPSRGGGVDGQPRCFNCFVVYARDTLDDGAVARDADAMIAELRKATRLAPAVRRLAGPDDRGCYDDEEDEATPAPSLFSRLFGKKVPKKEELYFGLAANEQQRNAARTLETKGFAVVCGPPGTGKSQAIANIICHYVATGRRVLVTSKGEEATEVLRSKLPKGIRELCVSLGGRDAASFRRLENAVERLADEVAAAPRSRLESEVARLRSSLRSLDSELEQLDALDAGQAAKHFSTPQRLGLDRLLGIHVDNLDILGVAASASATQLAAAATSVLNESSSFLDDVVVAPQLRPPTEAALESLRSLRRDCGEALTWERDVKAARCKAVDSLEDARTVALALRVRRRIDAKIGLSLLPRITDAAKARTLLARLRKLSLSLRGVGNHAWLSSLVRRADDPRVARRLANVRWLADRIVAASPRGLEGVLVPEVLLRVAAARSVPFAAPKYTPTDEADIAELVLGTSDFVDEVRRRAHPEKQRRWWPQWRRPTAGLLAELDEIEVGDRRPSTALDWQSVERRLVLRGCAARLRDELDALGAPHDVGPDDASLFERARQLAAPTAACCKALGEAAGLTDLASYALSNPPSPLEAASRGALDDEVARLDEALQAHEPVVLDALERQRLVLRELRANHDPAGPVGALVAATVGLDAEATDQAAGTWIAARARLREAKRRLPRLASLRHKARQELGSIAPTWARRVVAVSDGEPLPRDARRAWAAKAALAALEQDDGTDEQAQQREDRRRHRADAARRLLAQRETVVRDLVCAVAKAALQSAMSPELCAALVRLVSAVAAASGISESSVRAARLRADLSAAVNDCASAIPVWIMPCFRIAQSLPAKLASFDLVVLDEASQSDASALPALLRGKRVLVVGDHKQVSPTAAFTSEAAITELRDRLASTRHRYREQLLPGRSVFDLAQTCYADARVALSQHFRCVPALIAFSNAHFYHDRLEPRRLPPGAASRLEPAVVDVRVPNGRKKGKTNQVEAQAIVDYLAKELAPSTGELARRRATVAVISLMGQEQARLVRRLALDVLSDAQLATHRIAFGEPPTFQGDERDVVLLSMVASPRECPAQVGRTYDQRFNVAMSRARDRLVLFRSLDRSHINNPDDLKNKVIAFFKDQGKLLRTPSDTSVAGAGALEADVLSFLDAAGFVFKPVRIAGSLAVVEDPATDARLCVCLDGNAPFDEWTAHVQERRKLERVGFHFAQIWASTWLVNRARCQLAIRRTCADAGIRPYNDAMCLDDDDHHQTRIKRKAHVIEDDDDDDDDPDDDHQSPPKKPKRVVPAWLHDEDNDEAIDLSS